MAQQLHPLFSKRVVGGSAANDGEFPFAVFISSPAVTENTACAGAILTDQIVVTSAYCVYDSKTGNAVDPGSISIGYGKSNASQQPRATVEKIIINSTYNATSNIDDIALLQVNIGNKTSADVNRIPVYVGDIHSGDSLTVMGWGLAQKIGSAINNTLNYANVTVGDEYSCSGVSLYQNSNGRAICTRNVLTPGVGPCLGDYGGPLITYEDGVAKLVGVMSALATADGKKIDYCGNNNTLAYYTHISYYMGFLQLTTGLSENIFTGNEPLVAQQNSTNSGESGSNSKLSKGIIAAISIGAAIFVILVCALVFAIRFYRKKKRELKHEQQIYELGLQQLADELGGSYEPKLSSATSAFNSSAVTPLDDTSIFGRCQLDPNICGILHTAT
ncbi:trypsin-like cysteine/serine peptidase domain-containing protein [Coemansia spiralis]|nr:trypsin-like cysteine/serine peptidase domain-containing protein [Coemansia spiralis]